MKELSSSRTGRSNFSTLTALWVICEAFLGGIIHGLKLPVSGLVVGSSAAICIGLIAYYHPTRGAVLKATLLVAIFKMMLSPQSPPMAYVAVAFQGICGALLLPGKKYFAFRHTVFCLLALLESAVQRIVILTFIYGKNLWQVADESVSKLFGLKETAAFSLTLAALYIFIHLVIGLLAARFTLLAIRRHKDWHEHYSPLMSDYRLGEVSGNIRDNVTATNKRKLNRVLLLIFAVLGVLYLLALKSDSRQAMVIAGILFRSAALLACWHFIAGPLISRFITRWLRKKSAEQAEEIETIAQQLPEMTRLLAACWSFSARKKGAERIALFGKLVLVNTLNQSHEP